ncbi:MAG TPA: Asp-tRNA(Asn)/Glu-tRNA(Gln) amidotransferase subunit GatC [Spirochaetota bacterium]|nr:Asp-tRNA(Asn)/Glu-tRNA(Gln) amidotransferase subunit GatC [Spirochaetota bacterium]HNT09968.1 Asp-tRNA(Asn)/Glu-tRNA(Gln) amidotransferase subunit GatC [Spirochaetota bacterium]HNV45700.1 Asp-tRNA(Asn)/Glu-tRNA(Gln) amidotransferase subunit GatC [Spirochaetota bacterium]HOS38383.1 Asp-tRNA(Asn)/Glu-tRNA(Gln) amidotransferase subunit GatC [Spirochaetota bacterium]HPI21615.1 Asp-tRNA(Asn)/Glu-tRNA(Gln) amidotransferase subunit GatC [Spirochaetota bacterium]
MKIDREQIERVAELARLELTEDERQEFSKQLSDILSYVEKINELDTDAIQPADHIVDLRNVFREDAPGPSLPRAELERMAPRFEKGHVVVPRIIDEKPSH